MEKKELIAKVIALAAEAKYAWSLRDGLISIVRIRQEHERIDRDCSEIIQALNKLDE